MKVKILLLLIFVFSAFSCGEFIGFGEFSSPDLGTITKTKIRINEAQLKRLYDSVSKTESSYAPCRVETPHYRNSAFLRVRGYTSRGKPKKNFTLKQFVNNRYEKYALSPCYKTWGKNHILMYAYNRVGLFAPEVKSTALFVNGKYLGYYSSSRMYDPTSLKEFFHGNGGELFKVHLDSYSENPLYSKSEKKFPKNNNYTSLERLVYNTEHMTPSEWRSWISSNFDWEMAVKYLIVHDFFAVSDTTKQNFYIYHDKKYVILPWDNEISFDINYFSIGGDSKITKKLMDIDFVKTKYKEEFNYYFINGAGTEGVLKAEITAEINRIYAEMDKSVKEDPVFYYSYNDFLRCKQSVIDFYDDRIAAGIEAMVNNL